MFMANKVWLLLLAAVAMLATAQAGAVYTRWGKTSCGSQSSLVYAGRAAGAKYNVNGGTSDTLCMPERPHYLSHDTGAHHLAFLYGVEYETSGSPSTPLRRLHQTDMPCAVCHTSRDAVLTVPAQYFCPHTWSLEYIGYLMTEKSYGNERQRKDTVCVDKDAEAVPGSGANTDPALVYLTRATYNGLPCPPYDSGRVLPCAVCSK